MVITAVLLSSCTTLNNHPQTSQHPQSCSSALLWQNAEIHTAGFPQILPHCFSLLLFQQQQPWDGPAPLGFISGERVLTGANSRLGVLSHCNVIEAPLTSPKLFLPWQRFSITVPIRKLSRTLIYMWRNIFYSRKYSARTKNSVRDFEASRRNSVAKENVTSLKDRDEEWPPEYNLQDCSKHTKSILTSWSGHKYWLLIQRHLISW